MNKWSITLGMIVWIIPMLVALQALIWLGRDHVEQMPLPAESLIVDFSINELAHITKITQEKKQAVQDKTAPVWILQLGAFSDERYAKAMERKLKGANYPIYRIRKKHEGQWLNLLRMGPFVEYSEAEKYRDELNRQLKIKSFIFKVKT